MQTLGHEPAAHRAAERQLAASPQEPLSELFGRVREAYLSAHEAFRRAQPDQNLGRFDGPHTLEFHARLRAFNELQQQLNERRAAELHHQRREVHQRFARSRQAYFSAQEALERLKRVGDRGDDGCELAEFRARASAFHQLSRAAHELIADLEPRWGGVESSPSTAALHLTGEE